MRLLLIIATYLFDKLIFKEEGMERKRFEAKQWFINILLFGAVVMLLFTAMSCAGSQIVYNSKFLAPSQDGVAVCRNNRPFIVLRENLPEGRRQVAEAHEKIHARQMNEMGCKNFIHKYSTDRDFRLEKETEAYCESIAKTVLNRKDVIRQIVPIIYENHGKHLPFKEVESYVHKVCEVMERRYNNVPP